jgi:hypothetical protein
MMSVEVSSSPEFVASRPELVFRGDFEVDGTGHPRYDVAADGSGFVMIATENTATRELKIVLNWHEELKRLVPTE